MGDSKTTETNLSEWLRKLPHYLYVADLIVGKQVLEVGCGAGDGANFLVERGAARVVGIDEPGSGVEQAQARFSADNLSFQTLSLAKTELADDSFDCVLVPNGALATERPAVLHELRRVLAPNGHLIVIAPSADRESDADSGPVDDDGVSFHRLSEALSPAFAPVRVIGQAPLVAMSLVEYADGAAGEITFDTSLVEWSRTPDGEVTDYMAICGGDAGPPRSYSIVQLPVRPGLDVLEHSLGVHGLGLAGSASNASGTVSAQIATALASHAEHNRQLEQALIEQQAYSDEMREDLDDASARTERAEREKAELAEKHAALQSELKAWRTRASFAEGEVLRMRIERGDDVGADESVELDPEVYANDPLVAKERHIEAIRLEMKEAREERDRAAAKRREAESMRKVDRDRIAALEAELKDMKAQQEALAEANERADTAGKDASGSQRKRSSRAAKASRARRDSASTAPAAKDTSAEKPAAKKPAAKKTAAKKPAAKKTAAKKPAAKKTAAKKPAAKKTAAKKPAAKKTAAKKTAAKKPAAKKTAAKKPAAKKTAAKKPAAKKTAAKKPAAKKTAAKKPAAKKPAAKKTTARRARTSG